ncbi:MAG: DHA2 family efflux MFS transporter permease subunit [Burkholderiales bacterium]|jgi:DHA2 family multidrug resistance protein|uniref:MFS transporter n=1 Tax=Candidatus Desulfobacillus denitrificans TaxID=2608985 RepID=A0A809RU40_9PROT|nr:DHA2 family efflux MFS transporter permease subunit [Zoogloeaceae bacterium]MBP9655323.1 DHA2 family efflux MFS transporter permease subunit [Rhodocyclaceae bacterium]MCZ2175117.1 DHA2 family efflux MFS transporter permease subunit [Burkholderiales bacterium]OQY69696.1 MAG: MFS transporter [Rhodocyclaceae bacterium UTPRO2]BBO19927.1 MFS transporter [Candidatus Desulfobacillus denitrificans]GIK46294.1 MAG: MFS transporter [Betaproteobacteria bacterium]
MPHRPPHGSSLILLTLGLSLGTFMQVLDSSIANVSLPHISGDLAVSPNQGTWVITSFGVSNAIALPLTGWLTRRFGDVRLFVASTLLFTLASWLCGLAPSLPLLIAARVLQGAVAGPMIPLSQSLLLANYPPEKKGLALALWSTTVIVAPILGPILGGWITDNISWPWIFYINLPFGLLSAFLTWTLLGRRSSATRSVPIDKVGLFLLVVGVGALQILLDKGNDLDWFESQVIVVLAVVAVACLAVLVVWELTDRHPVVDLHLFAERNFLVGTIILSIGYLVFFGNVVILPLWLQTNMGYTATWAGLAAAPIGLLPVILSAVVGKNMHRIDLRIWASFSFAVFAAVSFWNSHFNTDVTFAQIVLPRLLMGAGVATFFVPLTALTLSGIPDSLLPSATGLSNFSRILAGSFGTSLSITLWDRRESYHYSVLASHVSAFDPNVTEALGPLASPATDPALLDRIIGQQSLLLATNDIFWLSGAFFLSLMILVWLAKPPRQGAAAAPPDAGAH